MPENQTVEKRKKGVFIRKIIFLSAILLFLIIGITVAYFATYNNNKMNAEKIFSEEKKDGMTYVEKNDFLKDFNEFYLYTTKVVDPYVDKNGDLVKGNMAFTLITDLKSASNIKDGKFTIKLALGADWISYKSSITTAQTITSGSDKSFSLSGLEQIFPANGPLLFTKVSKPTLYCYIYWSTLVDDVTKNYYTYLDYDYKTFTTKPTIEYAFSMIVGQDKYNLVKNEDGDFELPNHDKIQLDKDQTVKIFNETLQKEVAVTSVSPTSKASRVGDMVNIKNAGYFTPTIHITTKYKATFTYTYEKITE